MALTPFDINQFLKGQPAQTQSGKEIGRLKELKFRESDELYLTAIVDTKPAIWDINGIYKSGPETGMNLFMTQPVQYRWAVTETIEDTDPEDEKTYTKVILP